MGRREATELGFGRATGMEQQLSGHGGSVTRHWHDVSGLFRERHAELVRLALLVVGDRSTAEDVVQDVFARLYARDLLPRGGDSVSYVRAAVLNRCRSALRRRAVARRFGSARDLGPPDVAHGSAEDEAILAEDRRQVLAALAKLPVRRREVLVLRYWLGLSEARTVREDVLRPLRAIEHPRRRLVWAAPVAAVIGLLLVVALGMAVSGTLPGQSRGTGPSEVLAPDPFYIVQDLNGDRPVVRSTATGRVTATVPVPLSPKAPEYGLVAPASADVFFVASWTPRATGERLYRFQVTPAGRVSGFSAVPGGVLGSSEWSADAMAVSPDGSQVAVSFSFIGPPDCGSAGQPACPRETRPDYIVVVNTATGATSRWQGGLSALGKSFGVGDLSWTANGRELVYLGQWCRGTTGPGSESCPAGDGRVAEVRTLDPAAKGGLLSSGRLLLSESARYPFIAQAVISPDGSVITAAILTGATEGNANVSGGVPRNLSVDRISAATGRLVRVLYQKDMGNTSELNGVPDFLTLMPDGTGQRWILNGGICVGRCETGFNGWILDGGLVPLQPTDGRLADEGW